MSEDNATREDLKTYLFSKLPVGSRAAIPGWRLARATGIPERAMRKLLRELLNEGFPICGSSAAKGYFLPVSKQEIDSCLDELMSRIELLSTRRRALQIAGKAIINPQQPALLAEADNA
ncbi:hypothetical protein LCGC14_0686590 [marine sediment metagenome]|uniref:Helix-turn-helix type 11 domain-containing protein n=1 Tax=marine sediment metagenome TaxID=412755 RepID=A0A0F9R6Y9_9ZZZZ